MPRSLPPKVQPPKPAGKYETVEEFEARGGRIQHCAPGELSHETALALLKTIRNTRKSLASA